MLVCIQGSSAVPFLLISVMTSLVRTANRWKVRLHECERQVNTDWGGVEQETGRMQRDQSALQ